MKRHMSEVTGKLDVQDPEGTEMMNDFENVAVREAQTTRLPTGHNRARDIEDPSPGSKTLPGVLQMKCTLELCVKACP